MSTQWVGVGIRPNVYFVVFFNWQTTERERGWPNVVLGTKQKNVKFCDAGHRPPGLMEQ